LLCEQGRLQQALEVVNEVLKQQAGDDGSMGPSQESLSRRGFIHLQLDNVPQALADLEEARRVQTENGDRLILVDTLSYLALAYARVGDAERAIATSEEAIRLLTEIGYANMQPQRIFWHHYQILSTFKREPRLPYLQRAREFVDARAATLSPSQQKRFRSDVPVNQAILRAWEHEQAGHPATDVLMPDDAVAAPPAQHPSSRDLRPVADPA
jgi:tetratricopeptide (TPR) repeat protein